MSARSLRVELAPAPLLAAAILALHAAAAIAIAALMPGAAGWALAALVLALGAVLAWSRALLGSASSVRALQLGQTLEIELASGESFAAEVAERCYVGRFMVTLPLRRPTRRTLLVTRDMVPGDLFRRLRIWALWGRLPVAVKQLSS